MYRGQVRFAALIAAIVCAGAQSPEVIFHELQSDNAPGGAALALRDGKAVFAHGYGIADLKKPGERITPETNFRLASVTKQFTAMATMLLVHDGKLRYDETLTEVFPDFPKYGEKIRIRHLLTHTSGLQDYEDVMDEQHWDPALQISDAQVLELLKHASGTKFEPGTKWQYSNSGYVLLGLIVARASGKAFDEFLHERIFAPLGMNATLAYVKGKNEVPRRAYGNTFENGAWHETDQSPTSATLGDGGVYSSVSDLAKWLRALDENKLLGADEMKQAWTPVNVPAHSVNIDGLDVGYGFGWVLDRLNGHPRMWHHGETVGFRANVQRFPDRHLSVVVLENRTEPNPRDLATKLAEIWLK